MERIADKGWEILYLTEEVDEFVMQSLAEVSGKKLKSVSDPDALPETEEEPSYTFLKNFKNFLMGKLLTAACGNVS